MPDDQVVTEGSSGVAGSPVGPSSEDERIKGLQRALSAKARDAEEAQKTVVAMQARLEALELAQMSEPEREGFLTAKEKSQLAVLQAENERLKLAQKYPKIAPHYETLILADTAEKQFQYLASLLDPQAAPAADTISDVDMNNPMRTPTDPISLPPSIVTDLASADRILGLWGNQPLRGR